MIVYWWHRDQVKKLFDFENILKNMQIRMILLIINLLFLFEEVDIHCPHGGAVGEEGPSIVVPCEWDESHDVAHDSGSDSGSQHKVVLVIRR